MGKWGNSDERGIDRVKRIVELRRDVLGVGGGRDQESGLTGIRS
jgi:hypothetical protein